MKRNYLKITFLIISCFFHFSFLAASEDYLILQDKANLPILTPSFAKIDKAKILLKNGLQAYIISDPNTDQSAAALTVQAGSWDDPIEYPGLAHFLEHMLFLGTSKYPLESEYDRYIKENGGRSNAYTSNDYTCFLFSINNNAFPQALDRFSYFFKKPLFNPSGVSRELNAIDQEYAQNLDKDDIREIFTLKALANPGHPYHRFNIGNTQTLSKVSQQTLKEWYQKHYSSNLMRLMIISPLPLEQLKKMVVEDFSDIPQVETLAAQNFPPLFNKTFNEDIIFVEPIKNIRELTIVWNIPGNFEATQETKPDALICYVLGHEGKESLLAQLKREQLAEALSCGSNWLGPDNLQMYLSIDLTNLGIHQYQTVIDRVFEALANLRQKGIPQYLFTEAQQMGKIHYQYRQREDAFDSIFKHTFWLSRENLSSFPLYSQVIQKYDPEAINNLLHILTPTNALIMVAAPSSVTGVKSNQKEPWLGVDYAMKPIPSETIQKWKEAKPNAHIDLPAPNPYIPEHLSLVQISIQDPLEASPFPKPILIADNASTKVYCSEDIKFQQPKISWIFEIKTPCIDFGNAESVVSTDLFIKNAMDNLDDIVYPASLGGLNFSIERGDMALKLTIEGYSDKAQVLLEDILKKFLDPVSEDNFKKYKELLLRDYQNFSKEPPLKQASELLKEIINKRYAGNKAKITAIRRLSFKKYNDFFETLFKENYVQGMMYGNLIQSEAKKSAESFNGILQGKAYPLTKQEKNAVITLPEDKGPFYLENKVDVKGNAAILIIENPKFEFITRAAQQILMQAIDEPFFAQLRTKQQTGYIVASMGDELEKRLFDFFAVQTNTHDPRDLLARFELFIEGYLQEIEKEITPERFEILKNALILKVSTSAKNILEMNELLYKIAFKYEADFDWMDKRIAGFKMLDYPTFLILSKEFLGKSNKRRLGILIKGNLPEQNQFSYTRLINPEKIRSISNFTPVD